MQQSVYNMWMRFVANQIIIQIQCITHKPQSTVHPYPLWCQKNTTETGLINQTYGVYVSYYCSHVYVHIDEKVREVTSCSYEGFPYEFHMPAGPFTEQSVAFHSRLWPSSWREPAREAHPGPEVQRRGSCFSYFPSLAWTCWRAQGSRTLFIQKQWKTDHLSIFLYTLFFIYHLLYLTVFTKVAL